MSKQYSKVTIAFLAVLCCFIWGSAFALAKVGFEYMPPIRLSGYRFMFAGVLLMPVLLYQKYDWAELKGNVKFIMHFAIIQTFLTYGLFYYGLSKAPSDISAVINGAAPFYVATIAHFMLKGDSMTLRKIISILFGLSGVAFISLKNNVSLSDYPHFYIGIVSLIISNIIGSFTNILIVRHTKPISTIALTAFSCFLGGLGLLLLSFIAEPEGSWGIVGYPLKFYGALLWLAFIPASAFSIWYFIIKLPGVKVSELNIWKFLIPVFGVLLSWLIVENEHPNWYAVIGIVIVSISIIILQTGRTKKKVEKS